MSDQRVESQGKDADGREFVILVGEGPPESRKFYITLEELEQRKKRNLAYGDMWRASRHHQLKVMGVKTQADEEVLEEARKRELVQKKNAEVAEQNALDEMNAQQQAREKENTQ